MYAIMADSVQGYKFYGPFGAVELAKAWGKEHLTVFNWIVIKLRKSGECLDYYK